MDRRERSWKGPTTARALLVRRNRIGRAPKLSRKATAAVRIERRGAEMRHAVSRDLYRYWDDLRAGRTAPERIDIDPSAIRHVLAYTFVLDVAGPGRPRAHNVGFRLSGTRLDALFGRDLRGLGFGDIWDRTAVEQVEALLDVVLNGRSAVVAAARGAPPGHDPVDLELLLLPLRHHGRTQARILGSLASTRAPGWMGLSPAAPLDLPSFRTVMPAPWTRNTDRSDGVASGRASAPSGTPSQAAAQVGRFKVYQGGRPGA